MIAVRSVIFISCNPAKKYLWNCFSILAHVIMEFAGKEENQAKADLDSESGNIRIFIASIPTASPHWIRNRLTFSTADIVSYPENLVKFGTYIGVVEQYDLSKMAFWTKFVMTFD